jgi:hypothetical protein
VTFRPRRRASDADRAERERFMAELAANGNARVRAGYQRAGLLRRGMGSGMQKAAPNPSAIVDFVSARDEADRHPLHPDVGPAP